MEFQEEIEELDAKQRLTQSRLDDSKKTISDLQVKLQQSQEQYDTLNVQLQQAVSIRQEVLSKAEQLGADLKGQMALRVDLEKKLTVAQDEARKMLAQLNAVKSQKVSLEAKVKELESYQNVELGTIVVNPEPALQGSMLDSMEGSTALASSTGLEGNVLVVNKDYNFVVLNLGRKDNVAIGTVFYVYHNDKYIGDVKVEKVHDAMSACGFFTEDIKYKIVEGDKVVQKVK